MNSNVHHFTWLAERAVLDASNFFFSSKQISWHWITDSGLHSIMPLTMAIHRLSTPCLSGRPTSTSSPASRIPRAESHLSLARMIMWRKHLIVSSIFKSNFNFKFQYVIFCRYLEGMQGRRPWHGENHDSRGAICSWTNPEVWKYTNAYRREKRPLSHR